MEIKYEKILDQFFKATGPNLNAEQKVQQVIIELLIEVHNQLDRVNQKLDQIRLQNNASKDS